jgi:hypothetical protein
MPNFKNKMKIINNLKYKMKKIYKMMIILRSKDNIWSKIENSLHQIRIKILKVYNQMKI